MKNAFLVLLSAAFLFCGFLSAGETPAISIFGDSYSTFEGWIPQGNAVWYRKPPKNSNDVVSVEQTWWHQAIALLGGRLEKNESFSGSTICNTGYDKKDFSRISFLARQGRLGKPDLILICGATNDSWAKAPIGEYKYSGWTAQELYSFRPALAKLFSDLKKNYPQAEICFILNSELSKEINDSVHTICSYYSIPCLDLKNIGKQKGHPDIAGMKAMAEQVAAFIKNSANKK